MKKLVLIAVIASALLTVIGCNNGHDRNDDTGRGESHDRVNTTTGGRLP